MLTAGKWAKCQSLNQKYEDLMTVFLLELAKKRAIVTQKKLK